MAKKEKKRCKECEGMGKDCKCTKKGKLGYYGLEKDYDDDKDMNDDHPMDGDSGGGSGGMSEGIKMPKAPSDADKSMQGMSSEKKKKNLDSFKAAASEAKKRQSDKDRKDELASTRMKKGIKFYDAKGSGYIKGGKKTYD